MGSNSPDERKKLLEHVRALWPLPTLALILLIGLAALIGVSNPSFIGLAGGGSVSSTEISSGIKIGAHLYHDGRLQSGERGQVREFVGWNNCLYVSYASLQGNFYLDVWDIDNLD